MSRSSSHGALAGRRRGRPWVSALFVCTAALVFALPCRTATAHAASLDNAPLLGLGYSDANTNSQQLLTLMLGWRFRYDAGDRINGFLRDTRWRSLLVVEPSVNLIGGDQNTFELKVLPMLHLERQNDRMPNFYIEGGIGLIYSEIRRIGLGSQILFNNSIGFGWSFPTAGGRLWSIGYRFRHISHVKLWANSNRGLQTQFLTVTFAPAPN